jgi:hypothetical protein
MLEKYFEKETTLKMKTRVKQLWLNTQSKHWYPLYPKKDCGSKQSNAVFSKSHAEILRILDLLPSRYYFSLRFVSSTKEKLISMVTTITINSSPLKKNTASLWRPLSTDCRHMYMLKLMQNELSERRRSAFEKTSCCEHERVLVQRLHQCPTSSSTTAPANQIELRTLE